MKVNELNNLFVATLGNGINDTDFNILILAQDEVEAHEVAVQYFQQGRFTNTIIELLENLEITPFTDINTKFDCDYAITVGDDYSAW